MPKSKKEGVVEDSRIEIKIKKKAKPKSPSSKAVKIIACIIVIVALAYLLTSTKQAEIAKNNSYVITQELTEQEPYVIIEEYEDKEPLGPPKCGNTIMNFTATGPWISIAGDGSVVCSFNLTNLESREGVWEYRAYFPGVTGNRYAKKTVGPSSTETFSFTFDQSVGIGLPCEVSVISLPSIEKCYFPKETFYKIITKTRNVTKYRNVTRQNEITVSNETTSNITVNRFFGFPMLNFGW